MNLTRFLPGKFGKQTTTIPVVRLAGAIASSGSPIQRALSFAATAPLLERAFGDKRAPEVAIVINSPGGSPVQSRLIYTRIRELAEKHSKRVSVFVEDVAASGGYMLALAGDEIYADPTSIVGSIGVVAAGFGFDEAIEKLGIERRVYTAGKNKVMLDPFQAEKPKDVAYLKQLQLEIHEVFIEMVKERRGAKLANEQELFTGKFWTGMASKELGLVDHLGHPGTVLRQRYGEDAKLKLIQPRRGLFNRGLGFGVGNELAGDFMDAAILEAETRMLRARYGL